ncbi:outer membrane beta-barrel protein [Dyadobacter sp. CY326]|uniref:outer membrane beta-barrel protein n=1 Tax=Dyadobacter sp. CY326 TaxID=2907300 RepID=UPI001F2A8C2F|nr:outer membrane beta-barrel protein [Dyadobacter sp. CY326]MCE7066901.1 outer membrane beta-barrel protein [Dyadobacter sp. CY326]
MKRFTFTFLLITLLCCLHLRAQDVTKAEKQVDGSKWGFGLNGGYAQRAFRSAGLLNGARKRYIKDLKSGISFGGEVTYFPWKKVGFGLKYDRYQSKVSQQNALTEDVTIQILGGEVIHRAIMKNPKNSVLTSLLLGYQPYQNKTQVGQEQFTFNGKTMGWGVSVGFEHRISPRFAINVTGSATMGAIYRLDRTTAFNKETLHLSKDNSVDLSRFSATIGFKFY